MSIDADMIETELNLAVHVISAKNFGLISLFPSGSNCMNVFAILDCRWLTSMV